MNSHSKEQKQPESWSSLSSAAWSHSKEQKQERQVVPREGGSSDAPSINLSHDQLYVSDETKWPTIQSRVGDLPPSELLAFCDLHYKREGPKDVKVITSKGNFALKRHPQNQRGDESSIQRRFHSINSVGVLTDQRGGAFLMQHPDPNKTEEYLVLHHATLAEGLERAWKEDVNRTNRVVQHSISKGFLGCKIYSRDTPKDVLQFLIDYGNLLNDESTNVTPLQCWRWTAQVEAGFQRQKNIMGWTLSSVGQRLMDTKKLDFAQGMHPGMWINYQAYENCNTFYKQSQHVANIIA